MRKVRVGNEDNVSNKRYHNRERKVHRNLTRENQDQMNQEIIMTSDLHRSGEKTELLAPVKILSPEMKGN